MKIVALWIGDAHEPDALLPPVDPDVLEFNAIGKEQTRACLGSGKRHNVHEPTRSSGCEGCAVVDEHAFD